MATSNTGRNITLDIYNANGGSFHGLSLRKSTWDSIVMSLGDKITGDVYYPSNDLTVTMKEYVVYNGVHYTLVNPPVIVRDGMAKDNAELSGMTKYSFTFYHPMYMLGNFPFTDVAVTSAQEKYLSQNKTFSWIGNLVDFVAKLNKNLQGTEWCVEVGDTVSQQERTKLSDVMTFDKQTIADALKKGYETWKVPYIIDSIPSTDARYASGKRFLVRFGLPSQEILVENEQHEQVPFVFQFGQGVGLKNNSRTPRNNKIVTRIAGYGSETNVPYGYPQILWTGNQSWNYTINNDPSATNSYPIYDGIMNGQPVRLIKHPFTRTTLMPSIYSDTVNKKVNPNATGYDPTIEIKDYYDADSTYDNPIDVTSPSYEIHEFDKIKPELGDTSIVGVGAYDGKWDNAITILKCLEYIDDFYSESENEAEKAQLKIVRSLIPLSPTGSDAASSDDYTYDWSVEKDTNYTTVKYTSSGVNFEYIVRRSLQEPQPEWDDTMDGDGNYAQSYFKITLPQLSFDIYACAAVTQEMAINMRSGACMGCSFQVAVDWEDYKLNFYDADGNFAPSGSQRDLSKYPNSANGQIKVVVKKDNNTFGALMPNIYQQPASGDKFVILGISLPYTYVTSAEERLDDDMKQYMRDNNVYYYDYPFKFDEHFLATHTDVLSQMKPNIIVRFDYAGTTHALYIKQMTIKYGQSPLPQYDITLTDDVEIVLNQIGKVTDEVSNLRVLMGEGNGSVNLSMLDKRYLSKISDDRASGMIKFIRGLQIGSQFVSGLLGEGGIFRRDADGTTYIETDKLYVRMRAYFDTVEVRRYIHSAGNRIASKAGIKCTRVEYIDADGNVIDDATNAVKFRCYFRANDNGVTITNDFVVNDLAFCRETNVDTTDIDQHSYWRKVIGVGNTVSDAGELYIDLSASDCQSGSDIPIAQDDIIQLGNTTDTTRQGAIIEYVGGDDAPAYQIYQGINSYSLNNKNYVRFGYDSQSGGAQAFIGNPDQSTYLWYHNVTEGGLTFPRLDIKANVKFTSPTTHQETSIEAFASAVETSIEDLQSQIDGEIDTWFYDGTPTLNNAPASGWTTNAEKERHLGDLYYDIGTGQTSGFAYRFIKTESGGTTTYSWQYIDDTAITEALAKSAEAYDLADHKRRVFLTTPTPPYDNGDLWVNAVWPASGADQGATYNDDILRCVTSKTADGQFAIADWTLASKYTDDSALTDFVTNTYAGDLANINTQIDKKAETWYQDTDPSTEWTTDDLKLEHVGDIWCDTSTNGGKKTWIFRDRGAGQTNRFYWAQQSVPDVVFDTIDGKAAVYTSWNAWGNDLNVKDLFIPTADTTQGGVTYKANKVYRCTNANTPTFEEIHYTDDAALTNFLNGTYANDKQNLQSQIDGKAETWRQATNPATDWTSTDVKASHVGDLWMDTSSNGGNKTYIYQNTGTSALPVYDWVAQAVPDDVFDEIDGKAAIYVNNPDASSNQYPTNYHTNDLWILPVAATVNGVSYVQGEVLTATQDSETYNQMHWTKKVCYTNDDALNAFLNQYATDLSGINTNITNAQTTANNAATAASDAATAASNAQTSADNAAAVAAAANYLKDAFLDNEGNAQTTDIDGGLILSTIIGLRDANKKVWSGISGAYQTAETGTGYKGHGIAAWYGGGMVDGEVLPNATNQAKSLFRFDGSGYVASKNISWNASGDVTIQGYTIDATTLTVGGSNVATESALANYVTLATAQTITGTKTFGTADGSYIVIGAIRIQYDSTNNALKIVGSDGTTAANIYATGGVTAFGAGSGGSSGSGDVTWALLASSSDTRQIALSHLTGALATYATQSYVSTALNDYVHIIYMNGVSTAWSPTNGELNLGNIVKQVKVNGSTYSPNANGVADLGTISGSTGNYLPLTAGSSSPLSNTLYITRTNTSTSPNMIQKSGMTSVSYMQICSSNNKTAEFGFLSTNTWGIPDTGGAYIHFEGGGLFLNSSGLYYTNNVSDFDKYTVYHSGNLPAYPTKDSWNYDDVYLKKDVSGTLNGILTIVGNDTYPLVIKGDATHSVIHLLNSNSAHVSDVGWLHDGRGDAAYIANVSSTSIITCNSSGAYFSDNFSNFTKYSIYHSGNLSPLTTSNYGTYLNSIYHPYGGSSSIDFTANTITAVTNATNVINIGMPTFTWGGNGSGYSLIYGLRASDGMPFTMIAMPHIPFLEKNKRGFTASTMGAIIRFEGSTTSSAPVWDIGCNDADIFSIIRGGTRCLCIKSDNCIYNTSTYTLNSVWKRAIAIGGDDYNKAVVGYLYSSIKGVVYASHNNALNAWAPVYLCGSTLTLGIEQSSILHINSSGNIGIGTTSPSYKLDVRGAIQAFSDSHGILLDSNVIKFSNDSTYFNVIQWSGSTASHRLSLNYGSRTQTDGQTNIYGYEIGLYTNGTTKRLGIDSTGLVTIQSIEIGHTNEINGTGSNTLHLQYRNTGHLCLCYNGKNVGVGTTSPSYKLHVSGDVYATGGVTCLSDERKKDVIGELPISVNDIANAPAIRFLWKDDRIAGNQAGSIAQYWQKVLPEVITDKSGELSMQYGVAALVSSIIVARKVVNHEERIKQLEKENERLRTEIEQLRAA